MRTRCVQFRTMIAKAAEFAAKVLPVAREIGGTYRHIAAAVNERGIATPRGARWYGARLVRMSEKRPPAEAASKLASAFQVA